MNYSKQIQDLFEVNIILTENIIHLSNNSKIELSNQNQTKESFSAKWAKVVNSDDVVKLYEFQFEWFLKLYGFESVSDLTSYLSNVHVILDTGCGLGYKAAWFAHLAPHAIVIGVDISDSIEFASNEFKKYPNLFFYKGDIASTKIKAGSVDFTVCDQVLMHTEDPKSTFEHLSSITSSMGEFACYVYSKKALPRELIDDYFRNATHKISNEEMWQFADQLTELGKRLADLNVTIESPEIPLLGIKGGTYDIQRFIYWNFLKCFWKEDWGFELSKSTNFDWYSPSNAKRFTRAEFLDMAKLNNLEVVAFHEEEACYSGRFRHSRNYVT